MGTLFPWNVFITERAFFDARFAVPPTHRAWVTSWESAFGVSYMFANVLALAALVRVDGVSKLPPALRVPVPLFLCAVLLALAAFATRLRDLSGDATMAFSVAALVAAGALTALAQGGSFAAASYLPPGYNQALMSGQALAGVMSALAALLMTAASGGSPGGDEGGGAGASHSDSTDRTARAYFSFAAALVAACALGALFLPDLPFYRHHRDRAEAAKRRGGVLVDVETTGGSSTAGFRRFPETSEATPPPPPPPRYLPALPEDDAEASFATPLLDEEDLRPPTPAGDEGNGSGGSPGGGDDEALLSGGGRGGGGGGGGGGGASDAASECRRYRAGVFLTFAVTLSVFPATTSAIRSEFGRFGALWTPGLFLLFNVADLAGRCFASAFPRTPPGGRAAILCSLARLALLPPLLACDVDTAGRPWAAPRVLAGSDLAPLALVAALGFSNGHVGSACATWGPHAAPIEKRAREGTKTGFAVVAGLAAGSVASGVLGAVMRGGDAR